MLKKSLLWVAVLSGLILPVAVLAQQGNRRPTPPSTSGASLSFSTPSLNTPSIQRTARSGSGLAMTRTPVSISVSRTPGTPSMARTPDAPVSSADASQAIVLFTSDQLGLTVNPIYAGESSAAIDSALQSIPSEIQADFSSAMTISGVTYWGLLNNGAAGVAVGDCSTDPATCTVSADNLSVQLSSASTGIYALLTTQTAVTTAQGALSLIETTFPKLNGLPFTPISDIDQGFAFSASLASIGYDAQTKQPVSAAKGVYAGVVNVNGKAFVYTLVAVGEGYVDVVGQ